MVNQTRRRAFVRYGAKQGAGHPLFPHPFAQRMADDLARVQTYVMSSHPAWVLRPVKCPVSRFALSGRSTVAVLYAGAPGCWLTSPSSRIGRRILKRP